MKELLNSFLGMNMETRERTVGAIVIYILNFLVVFRIIEFSNEQVEALAQLLTVGIVGIMWWLSHYYNNDYTEVAARYTGAMRQEKKELEEGYVGDYFYTDEPFDDSVEEEEEANEQELI